MSKTQAFPPVGPPPSLTSALSPLLSQWNLIGGLLVLLCILCGNEVNDSLMLSANGEIMKVDEICIQR